MVALLLLAVWSCSLLANGVLISEKIATREEIAKAGWVPTLSPLTESLQVSFALKIDRDLLEKTALDVALPKSPSYGKHLSREQLTKLISPPNSTIQTVVLFLNRFGVTSYELKSYNGYVYATMTAQTASEIFQTTLYRLTHGNGRIVPFHSFDGLNLPTEVADVVTYVGGIETSMPVLQKPRVIIHGTPQTGATTVADLKKLYFVPDTYNATNGTFCTQGVAEFESEFFNPNDLQIFFKAYSPNNVGRNVTKVVGDNNQRRPGEEGNLDVQYMMAMGSACDFTFYYEDDGSYIVSVLDFFTNLNNETDPELIISISWGIDGTPFYLLDQIDQECAKLGIRGVSILFASGDVGVGCSQKGENAPELPNSPHMLMVGGTALAAGVEIGAKLSSGGFSLDYPIQSWQADVVANFFTTAGAAGTLPPANQYNASGRGFPDVSAIGVDLPIIEDGQTVYGSGTSFSSPIFGGILSLLNDIRASAGKSSLGWVNPLLYQIAADNTAAFTDITSGPRNGDGVCVGFLPQQGWDPVTGLGSPNFQVLAKIINNY